MTRPIEQLELRRLLAAYAPDVSFGIGGTANLLADENHGSDVLSTRDIDALPDGKLQLAVAKSIFGGPEEGGDFSHYEFFQTRLNPDGTFDTSFGTGGTRDATDDPPALIGSRYYLSNTGYPDHVKPFIVAHKPNGDIDISFSGDGRLELPWINRRNLPVYQVSIGPIQLAREGKDHLLVQFYIHYSRPNHTSITDGELVKLNPDGSVDTSFGQSGFLQLKNDSSLVYDTPQGIYSFEFNDQHLRRFRTNGRGPDGSFGGGDGIIDMPPGKRQLTFLPDGKILFLASAVTAGTTKPTMFRLNADGSPDTSFGTDGSTTLFDPAARSYADMSYVLDNLNRIWVAASDRLWRLSSNGVIDASPLNGTIPFENGVMTFDSAGRLVVGRDREVTRYDFADPIEVGRDNILYITGDAKNDTASISLGTDGRLHAVMNGVTKNVRAKPIGSIKMRLFDGNNVVSADTDIPVEITCGAGNDRITTLAEDDQIESGTGNDTIDSGAGKDLIETGISFGNANHDADFARVTGGDGDHTVRINSGRSKIDLGDGDNDVRVGITAGDSDITIAGGNNTVDIWGADVTLDIGGDGNNDITVSRLDHSIVNTGDGDDSFTVYDSATINSHGGNDRFVILGSESEPVKIDAGAGNDRVEPQHDLEGMFGTIHLGVGNDYFEGSASHQTVFGDAGNDTLIGGGGDDFIDGGSGNDSITTGDGRDEIFGGPGKDIIRSGGGNDLILDVDGSSDSIFGGPGSDRAKRDRKLDRLDSIETIL
jgi:uncharacterized delta-60 repeat protein